MAKRRTVADDYGDVMDSLKKKIYKPIYVLTGDEHYYIDRISDYIAENVLSDSEKAFNLSILYGKDVTPSQVVEVSRRFPMMANHQVVILKEAQSLKGLEEMEVYLRAPQKSTILVVCVKISSGAKPTKLSQGVKKFFTQVKKVGTLFESPKMYDYQVPEWITTYVSSKGVSIAPAASEMLKEHLGADLSRIANELDKLFITIPPDVKLITADHIERNIGISKEFNRFEFTKALGARDVLRVNRIVDYFHRNPSANPLVLTISATYQYFLKIFKYHFLQDKSERNAAVVLGVNPFFVSEYKSAARIYTQRKCVEVFALLREFDMRSKGLGSESAEEGDLLKELTYRIMH